MEDSMQRKDSSTRLAALDGLRGYAAIAVVIYHAILFPIAARASGLLEMPAWALRGYDLLARLVLAVTSGETAVILFFAMSGAVLMMSLERDTKNSSLAHAVLLFPARRALRIYPALLGCLVGMFLIYSAAYYWFPGFYQQPSTTSFIVNGLLTDTAAHGATWTLKAELLAIPYILIAFLLRRLFGSIGLFGLLIYSLLILESPFLSFGMWMLPGWLMYFVAGFIAYDLRRSTLIADLMNGYRWIPVMLTVLMLRACFSPRSTIGLVIQLAGIIVVIAYILGENRNHMTSFLSSRVSVFFGKISYSLYLWNVVFLNIILIPAIRLPWVNENFVFSGILIGAVATGLSIPVAMLSERYLERPFSSLWKSRKREAVGLTDSNDSARQSS